MLDIVKESVKAFVRLCNKKDFSHLLDRVYIDFEMMETSEYWEEIFGEDDSEPIDIVATNKQVKPHLVCEDPILTELDSDEEFSSTEESPLLFSVSQSSKRRRKRRKSKKTSKPEEEMMFPLDLK